MKTARRTKTLSGWKGEAAVYKLEPPPCQAGKRDRYYVIVSDIDVVDNLPGLAHLFDDELYSSKETMIFRSTRSGGVMSWEEMEGSFRGGRDHARALSYMGYKLR